MEHFIAIKAVGDWELDILAIPFGSRDADGQWFDSGTDISAESFKTPLLVYQHGISEGAKSIDEKPLIVGKTIAGTWEKRLDGWHIRGILDKTIAKTKQLMDAAKQGLLAVSSGSISHLARLDVGGRFIQYEKSRPGRIAVWPTAEISIWEKGNGNAEPANQYAMALPAMKAIYREAGLSFPELDTGSGEHAEEDAHRVRVKAAKKKARELIKRMKRQ